MGHRDKVKVENRYVCMTSLTVLGVLEKSSFLCLLVYPAIFPLFYFLSLIFLATVTEKVVSAQLFDSFIV